MRDRCGVVCRSVMVMAMTRCSAPGGHTVDEHKCRRLLIRQQRPLTLGARRKDAMLGQSFIVDPRLIDGRDDSSAKSGYGVCDRPYAELPRCSIGRGAVVLS